ncbi:hypothetical protein [Streptomyces spinosisporus]|uniref:Uncharacterized protein n=1 Tax=Streptomyces spinosisporus TaxID=2927582 RepID=A0ABS9XE59_9ACTN|nr:hypothetical protein [Streptomyces spinosisporus]MCI3240288.1 hypothetical protein [Streptomyces spinosisporus]
MPSHLVPLRAHSGVPLLYRTVGQAREISDDVHLTCPAGDTRYKIPGVTVHEQEGSAPSEYAATRGLWNEDGRTVLLLGDVYFTDRAMETIAAWRSHTYRVFGRAQSSRITGTPYGEIFAASWWPGQHTRMDVRLRQVHELRAAQIVTRPPGWMLLRSWQRTPLDQHRVDPGWFTEINDWTDDFDTVADYVRHPATRGA